MIYIGLIFLSAEVAHESQREQETIVTLSELEALAGISRPKIIEGVTLLADLGVITVAGTQRKRLYVIHWTGNTRWYKVPCRVHFADGVIKTFADFALRNRVELDALKIFLYLANVRDSSKSYSLATYEKITEKTGVSRPQIRRAIAFLIQTRLIANVHRENDQGSNHYGPNQYFLDGYRDLFVGLTTLSDV